VEKILRGNAKLNADHELYLHADRGLLYGDVVKIMAAVKQAGDDADQPGIACRSTTTENQGLLAGKERITFYIHYINQFSFFCWPV